VPAATHLSLADQGLQRCLRTTDASCQSAELGRIITDRWIGTMTDVIVEEVLRVGWAAGDYLNNSGARYLGCIIA
jgi:hypothetical protein